MKTQWVYRFDYCVCSVLHLYMYTLMYVCQHCVSPHMSLFIARQTPSNTPKICMCTCVNMWVFMQHIVTVYVSVGVCIYARYVCTRH